MNGITQGPVELDGWADEVIIALGPNAAGPLEVITVPCDRKVTEATASYAAGYLHAKVNAAGLSVDEIITGRYDRETVFEIVFTDDLADLAAAASRDSMLESAMGELLGTYGEEAVARHLDSIRCSGQV